MKRFLAIAGLIGATFGWGSSFVFGKTGVAELGVWPLLFWRFTIAAVFFCILFWRRLLKSTPVERRGGAILGFLLFSCVAPQVVGLLYTTASHSSFITSLYVPLTPLCAWVLFRQRVNLRQVIVIVVAVFGLYLLSSKNFQGGFKGAAIGDTITLFVALMSALHIVATEKYSRLSSDSFSLAAWQYVSCAVITIVSATMFGNSISCFTKWNPSSWSKGGVIAILFLSLITTCFAFTMQILCQKTVGAMKAALVFALEAPIATAMSFLIINERLTAVEWLGAGIVFFCSIIPEAWLKKEYGSL